jgi:hypothetical protein
MSDIMKIAADSLWEYKGKLYKVNAVLPNNLIQYEDCRWPAVRYTREPQTGFVFYRSTVEFYEKFRLVP